MSTIISVEGVSKLYHIGRTNTHGSLRETISGVLKRPLASLKGNGSRSRELWALKNISFDVKEGEVLGIIGRNGAGKSTLLKILSRITEPTSGRIELYGRVGSLLEVGTGFHPELTGRENVFLNGAILGMGRAEIRSKFDEIVAFSEVEEFIDTPVKYYSSGMYVRLAFAVAAHLDPEILIVDEVLAVGDVQFQKKCLQKMEDVRLTGRTVLFVSHSLSSVHKICSRAIVLESGQVDFNGETGAAIDHYAMDSSPKEILTDLRNVKRMGTGSLRLTGFSLEDLDGRKVTTAYSGQDLVFVFDYELATSGETPPISLGFSLHNTIGEVLTVLYSDYQGVYFSNLKALGKIRCVIHDFPYSSGIYYVGARVLEGNTEADWPQEFIGRIEVEQKDFYDVPLHHIHGGLGPMLLRGEWGVAAANEDETSLDQGAERRRAG